jgi:arylsulfatase A-like enzyme
MGDYHRGVAFGPGLRHWYVGEVAPWECRRAISTHQGFDEWYGIPRTYDEGMWPGPNETDGMWPSTGSRQGWNTSIAHLEPIYEARKGENAKQVGELTMDARRNMEGEITKRAVDFIKRNANAGKPFYAYVSSSMVHMPTLPNPAFVGKTGNGDWADCLAEMDYRTGQILDALKDAGIEDNTCAHRRRDRNSVQRQHERSNGASFGNDADWKQGWSASRSTPKQSPVRRPSK